MTDTLTALVGIVAAQQASIETLSGMVERQTQAVTLLTAAVADLLGEEFGKPVGDEPEPVETDWDGNPIR